MATPHDFDEWPDKKQKQYALDLLLSARGNFIVGKALALAYKEIMADQHPAVSDAEDMAAIGHCLFEIGWHLEMTPLPPVPKTKRKRPAKKGGRKK